MRLAWLVVPCLVFACSGDDAANDSGAPLPTTTAAADTGAGTTKDGDGDQDTTAGSGDAGTNGDATSGASTGPGTTAAATSADGTGTGTSADDGPDCTAPTDCETCFNCAVNQGPCAAGYNACTLETFCVPSLVCVQSMCTPDGLMQSCVDTCCMSCVDLGTCGQVDPVVQCAQAQCADLCGPVSCP